MMVYLASDRELSTIPWDSSHPGFHVTKLAEKDSPVRKQFSKPFVYYVGSHEGCGCGFQYGEYEGTEQTKLQEEIKSRGRLVDYLTAALEQQETIDLYACWDGDQAAVPEFWSVLKPSDLLQARTFFREKELLTLSKPEQK